MRSVGNGSWFQLTIVLVPCLSVILAQEFLKGTEKAPDQSHLLSRTTRSLAEVDVDWIRENVEQVVESALSHLDHDNELPNKRSPAANGAGGRAAGGKQGNFDFLNRNGKRSRSSNGPLNRNSRTNFDFLNRNGKRSDFDFLNRNGKRSDFDFLNRNGKRSDFDFLNRNGKRSDFDFFNRNGKRSDFDFLNRNGKRSDFDFLNRNGKRSDFDFLNRNGRSTWKPDLKRSDFDFLNRNGKRSSSKSFMVGDSLNDLDESDFLLPEPIMDPSRIDAIINNAAA